MHRSYPLLSVVDDVLGPGLALDVDDDAAHRPLKVHRHERAQVALRVLVRVEEAGEALRGVVLNGADVLDVRRVLALARHPDRVEAVPSVGLLALDKVLEPEWHSFGQVIRLVVVLGDPAVDLVELQEHARGALVVVVVVLLHARRPALDVHVAHLALWRRLLIVAVVDVLATTRSQTGHTVNWKRGKGVEDYISIATPLKGFCLIEDYRGKWGMNSGASCIVTTMVSIRMSN